MKRFFLILPKKILPRTDNIVQLHFWHKYSFQRAPNQVEKLRKFQGVGGGGVWQAPPGKQQVPSMGEGGCVNYFLELHIANIYKFFQFFQKKAGIVFKRKQNNLST